MRVSSNSIALIGTPALHYRLPFIAPAPLLYFRDLFEKLIACFYSLGEEAQKRVVVPPEPHGAVKYGKRTKKIITIFNIIIPVTVQRFRTPDGKTHSQDTLTLPQGLYDINIVMFAVTLYESGVSAQMITNILSAYFGVDVSVGTVLNWVKHVADLGYAEHRRVLWSVHENTGYSPRQVGMDEMYFTIVVDEPPLGISFLVDLERSLILDVYSFDGRNISMLDVQRVYQANREYVDDAEIVTTDGAKAYEYFVKLIGDAVHIVCVQHKTRNIRKKKITKQIIEQHVEAEKEYLNKLLDEVLRIKEEKVEERLTYALPKILPKKLRDILRELGITTFSELKEITQQKYQDAIGEYLDAYEAYVHHRLYISEQASLVGRLRMIYKESEQCVEDGALKRANKAVLTTAMLEGLNRPLRNRLRYAEHYRDRKLTEALSKLFLLRHNTLGVTRGQTPYEEVGIPVWEMVMNPFARLYTASRGGMSGANKQRSVEKKYRIRKERYGRWYSKMVELRNPLIGLESEAIEDVVLNVVLSARAAIISL